MAGCASYRGVRAGQREGCLIVIEHRSRPRCGCMAGDAGSGEAGGDVIGIRGAGVVGLVAGIAVGRRARKLVVDVARCAGHRDVRAGQRESRLVVVEYRAGPRRGVVAGNACGGESCRNVIWIRGAAVIGFVARVAVSRRAGKLVVDVARRAGDGGVGAGERERRLVVIEHRAGPRRGVVAGGTSGWESAGDVVGIGCAGEIGFVARVAIGRGALEDVVDVAGRARYGGMGAGEREGRLAVIECCARPRCCGVASGACCGESRIDVVGICGRGVFVLMARVAIGRSGLVVVVSVA